jgi:cytochrome c-type biogenesis protein CcmH
LAYWQRARSLATDPVLTREFEERIAEARALQARPASAVAAAPAQIAPPNPAAFVSGRIVLSDKLKSQVSANDVLFVFARPVEGSRMPIALMRRRASELPIEFRLDDSMAMVPQARLSTQARVIVGARVSKRGDASPQAGDLQGFSAPVAVGTPGLRLEIAEVVK